jgi:hypothetical protein
LKLEIVELSLNEEPQIDDEQTIRDADQTVKEEELEEASSSSSGDATSEDEEDRFVAIFALFFVASVQLLKKIFLNFGSAIELSIKRGHKNYCMKYELRSY